MKPKVSITERLAGSIHLDDRKLIDEILQGIERMKKENARDSKI